MKSGFTPLFTDSDLERWFYHFQERAEEKILKILQGAGETFIKYARESGKYTDHTGNLRSSVGYLILLDGKELISNFEQSEKGTDKATGLQQGRKLSEIISQMYLEGFILIGVAGMEYAVYVESIEAKDVISSASIQAENWLKKALAGTFNKIRNG